MCCCTSGRNDAGYSVSPVIAIPPPPPDIPRRALTLDAHAWMAHAPLRLVGAAERGFLIDLLIATTTGPRDPLRRIGWRAVDAPLLARLLAMSEGEIEALSGRLSAAGLLSRPHRRFFAVTAGLVVSVDARDKGAA